MKLETMLTFWEIDNIRLIPPNALAQDNYTLTNINIFYEWLSKGCNWQRF